MDAAAVVLADMPTRRAVHRSIVGRGFWPPRRPRAAGTGGCAGFEGCAMIRRYAVESSSSEADLGLLQRIATRDETALAQLYDRHCRLAYSVIMRILRSPPDAEEVLQETFVRVWSRAETYDVLLGSPAAWLLRIARNGAIDRLRARRARANVDVDPAVHPDGNAPRAPQPVTHHTPETTLEDRAMVGAVRTALATLTPAQRELIEAAFFEGYTHTELAVRFGVPLGTVKTRIRTGLTTMRGRLEQVI
jgi:RNA polymerase sigma-70 factor (ECF subfamily)